MRIFLLEHRSRLPGTRTNPRQEDTMATRQKARYSPERRSSGSFVAFALGVVCTLVVLLGGGAAYLRYGHLPVAVADPAFPMEAKIVHVPLQARVAREIRQPPFGISEDVFETGAKVYEKSCASCHGSPGHDSPYARWMYPAAPQLWKRHGTVVGVSDDEPGETYWKVSQGIRLSGMPAYGHLYSEAQMWDVALLLKNADQPLPEPVERTLAGGSAPLLNRPAR